MKEKLNLVCDAFTHLTGGNKGYSVHGKTSKYIEWVFDNSADITFYVDNKINQALNDKSDTKKYGWLHESKYIIPHIIQDVKNNYQEYFEVFDIIFTHNKELLDLDERFKWVPANGFWIKEPKIYDKSKMISFITSNKNFTPGHAKRLEWVQRIGDQVDLYGRGFSEVENKEDALCDYMFSVVVENGFYESYYTEKILDCFATGTVPVYLGCPNIGDFFNIEGIIELTDEFDVSDEIYYDKMDAIKDNLERVKQIEVLEDYIYKFYLEKNVIV
jgi:hypothetical protein